MLEKIKQVIAEQLDVNADEITEDTVLTDDLGADSLDIVELVMAFESEYDIELPTEELENISTVKDIIDLMRKMGVDA
ncbi:MAG: acyl carrier protein [Lachnospiraceae bacterium]|nr:acyl carrier protein [Lachnospiraceae bacterium]MBP5223605.1 acyl carrier protein [Lachnospiraceae bacterium]